MKKLFLTSSFDDVSGFLTKCLDENVAGKKVTFIPTASLVEEVNFYVQAGKDALLKLGLIVDELDISIASEDTIKEKILNNQIIYVSGGNTFYLLQELKKTGTDKLIIEHINKGKLYIGESAGSIILSPNIEYVNLMDDNQKSYELNDFNGLNVIDFYPLPHYKSYPFEEATEQIINKYDKTIKLYPITNEQAIYVNNSTVNILQE